MTSPSPPELERLAMRIHEASELAIALRGALILLRVVQADACRASRRRRLREHEIVEAERALVAVIERVRRVSAQKAER